MLGLQPVYAIVVGLRAPKQADRSTKTARTTGRSNCAAPRPRDLGMRVALTSSVCTMSTQSLVKLAALVWSAAILVAVFVGLPALLTTVGVELNAGLIVNALAAIGSLSAASVALWVATSDRRERKRERNAEDVAQSKLVVIRPLHRGYDTSTGEGPMLAIDVINCGTRAIVDVTFLSLDVEGHEHLDPRPTSEDQLPVVQPHGGFETFKFDPKFGSQTPPDQFLVALRGGGRDVRRTIDENAKLTARVRWTDASGNTWERRASGRPLVLEKPRRISS